MKKRRLGKNIGSALAIQAVMAVVLIYFINQEGDFKNFLVGTVVPAVFIIALGAWQIYVIKEHGKEKIRSKKRKGK